MVTGAVCVRTGGATSTPSPCAQYWATMKMTVSCSAHVHVYTDLTYYTFTYQVLLFIHVHTCTCTYYNTLGYIIVSLGFIELLHVHVYIYM